MLRYNEPAVPSWAHRRPKRFFDHVSTIYEGLFEDPKYFVTVVKPGYYKVSLSVDNATHITFSFWLKTYCGVGMCLNKEFTIGTLTRIQQSLSTTPSHGRRGKPPQEQHKTDCFNDHLLKIIENTTYCVQNLHITYVNVELRQFKNCPPSHCPQVDRPANAKCRARSALTVDMMTPSCPCYKWRSTHLPCQLVTVIY